MFLCCNIIYWWYFLQQWKCSCLCHAWNECTLLVFRQNIPVSILWKPECFAEILTVWSVWKTTFKDRWIMHKYNRWFAHNLKFNAPRRMQAFFFVISYFCRAVGRSKIPVGRVVIPRLFEGEGFASIPAKIREGWGGDSTSPGSDGPDLESHL